MKKIFRSVLFLSVLAFVSCADELDINDNPNTPPAITPGLALASAEASLVTVVGGELTNLGGFYAQYQTQSPSASQYESIDSYNINADYSDRLWAEMYAGCLTDLEFVINESKINEDTGTALIATCLKAYAFQTLTDLYGPIPYKEALQGVVNITPALTPQEEIYPDLILKLDDALASYNANPVVSEVGKQDDFYMNIDRYKNDANPSPTTEEMMDNWVRFANTLKLRIYMRMSYTSMANPGAVAALISENHLLTKDAAFANFNETLDKTNPFYGVQISNQGSGLADVNNIASNSLIQFYTLNADPRREAVYRGSTTNAYIGLPQGAGDEFNNQAQNYSRPNIKATTPVYLLTVAESNFLQAEGLIRYSGGVGAKEKYDEGVQASFNLHNLGSASSFTGSGGAYEYVDAGSTEGNVRQVIVQKWAALAFVNNIEAYFETTRTKYPEVVVEGTENYTIGNRIPSRISVLSGTQVPSILFYSDDEVNRNPNVPQRSSLTEKVWWDQK